MFYTIRDCQYIGHITKYLDMFVHTVYPFIGSNILWIKYYHRLNMYVIRYVLNNQHQNIYICDNWNVLFSKLNSEYFHPINMKTQELFNQLCQKLALSDPRTREYERLSISYEELRMTKKLEMSWESISQLNQHRIIEDCYIKLNEIKT